MRAFFYSLLGYFLTPWGLILMGARLYNRATGQFTSTDPIHGGNSTAYTYPQDPINGYDLTGEWGWGCDWCKKTAKKAKKHVRKHWKSYVGYGASAACLLATAGACGVATAAVIGISVWSNAPKLTTGSKRSRLKAAGSLVWDVAGARMRPLRVKYIPARKSFGGGHRRGGYKSRHMTIRGSVKRHKIRSGVGIAYNVGSTYKTYRGW